MFDKKDMKELIVDCKAPDEMANAKVIDAFRTPSSESYLVEVGSFSDGAKMYVMTERFESTGWKWRLRHRRKKPGEKAVRGQNVLRKTKAAVRRVPLWKRSNGCFRICRRYSFATHSSQSFSRSALFRSSMAH